MADTQQRTTESGGVKELVILVGILLTVIAGAVGTYWIRSRGVEAAPGASAVTGKPSGESTRPRTVVPAPPAGVLHAVAAPSTLAVAGTSATDRAQADSTSPAGDR